MSLPDEDETLGPPVDELRSHLVEPKLAANMFLARVERRIERRVVTGDLTRMWWETPSHVIIEIIKAIFEPNEPAAQRLTMAEEDPHE